MRITVSTLPLSSLHTRQLSLIAHLPLLDPPLQLLLAINVHIDVVVLISCDPCVN